VSIAFIDGFGQEPTPRSILAAKGRCRNCGSTDYTREELNLHPGQHWQCYGCFDGARHIAVIVGIMARLLR
jgi:hypothetical protein